MDVPTDRDANRLKDILSSSNLSQFVTEPTHISGHILDLVIARSDDNVVDSVTVPFLFTDHAVIHCKLALQKPRFSKKVITYRKWKSIDKDNFAKDLQLSNLMSNSETDLDTLVNNYDTTLHDIINNHVPLKQRTVTIRPSNPWYSPEIDKAKKLRKQLERRWCKSKLEIDR